MVMLILCNLHSLKESKDIACKGVLSNTISSFFLNFNCQMFVPHPIQILCASNNNDFCSVQV